MNTRNRWSLHSVVAGILLCLLAVPLQATTVVIVDDSFTDGDRLQTGALDTNWWTSSSSAGDEISGSGTPSDPFALGLVTGTSGRGIHTVFPTQTLVNIGDSIKASYTYTTPATIDTAGGNSAAFRVGLFDTLGQADLNADVSASSGSPSPLYGWGIAVGGPGTPALPGYLLDMDVFNNSDLAAAATADLNFREHSGGTLSGSGRLLATTSGFSNISPSGPDEGYVFDPNTEYTGSFSITLISATEVELTGTLDGITHSVTDEFDSLDFGLLGFHVNSNKFGSSNTAGEPDNGIDFSNIRIEFHAVPEPSSIVLLAGMIVSLAGARRR